MFCQFALMLSLGKTDCDHSPLTHFQPNHLKWFFAQCICLDAFFSGYDKSIGCFPFTFDAVNNDLHPSISLLSRASSAHLCMPLLRTKDVWVSSSRLWSVAPWRRAPCAKVDNKCTATRSLTVVFARFFTRCTVNQSA